MTRPIRNTGPCFPSGLPRQRGQRDVLSHTEFYTPIFCMLSVFQAIPFELPRMPPTVNRWDSTLGTPGWGQVLQSISSPKCKVCPRDHGKVVESLRGGGGGGGGGSGKTLTLPFLSTGIWQSWSIARSR